MVLNFAGGAGSSQVCVGCEGLFYAQRFVRSLNISLSSNLPFNYIVVGSCRKGRRREGKKRQGENVCENVYGIQDLDFTL